MEKSEDKLTLEDKEAIAEYAAYLGNYDFWYYNEEEDVYNEADQSLLDCVTFISKQKDIADEAMNRLKELGLI